MYLAGVTLAREGPGLGLGTSLPTSASHTNLSAHCHLSLTPTPTTTAGCIFVVHGPQALRLVLRILVWNTVWLVRIRCEYGVVGQNTV
jgi:hypothetical protein